MKIALVDGTYELFRHFFAVPPRSDANGIEIGAVRGVVDNIARLLSAGATHVGVATDHVIESFRNEIFDGYKTGAGIDPVLFAQFVPLEDALRALGVTVWPMVRYEADDALAAAAHRAARTPGVDRVEILTPDKDLAQCVRDPLVVQVDRRRGTEMDEAGVMAKFGVRPEQIPDYLALVGDTADGLPGVPAFGAKTSAHVLARYATIEDIPERAPDWDVPGLRGIGRLAENLTTHREAALRDRHLATLVVDGPDVGDVEHWEWRGPTDDLLTWEERLGLGGLVRRMRAVAETRGSSSAGA